MSATQTAVDAEKAAVDGAAKAGMTVSEAADALGQDPPAAVNSRQRTKYNVFADAAVLRTVMQWRSDQGAGDEAWPLGDSFPDNIDDGDLIYLGTYSAANKDAAVDMMLTDKRPTDRVRLVQLAHEAHLDLYFPAPPASFLTAVAKEWQQEWTLRPAGRS